MKIVRVETVSFGIPIKAFADANAQYDKTIAVLVKIYADDGTIGFGEHYVKWDLKNEKGALVANGAYLFRLTIEDKSSLGKAIILK